MANRPGTLFVVATPLGNLEDFTPRAVRILREADHLYAEDTRRSRILLEHFGVPRSLRSLHEHNERERAAEVISALERGESVALLTDAGTPAVSDPGSVVVARAAERGLPVSPIPGPSALTAALSVAGFSAGIEGVLFGGFLPARGRERETALERVAGHAGIAVLFEAPHRVGATLAQLADRTPERPGVACRELTKVHEEVRRGTLRELATWASAEPRGELTIVLGPTTRAEPETAGDAELDAMLGRCLEAGLSARDASSAVAALTGRPRREVYARCETLKRRS